jgi:hypothetical protein
VLVNVGSVVGVTPGMKMIVMEDEEKGAELLVKEVREKLSSVVPLNMEGPLEIGWRVEGS